jgi:glutamine amidotransferase
MKIAVIKYNAGNIRSISFALDRMGTDYVLTDNPEDILHADKVIFPGVGEASSTMKFLRHSGLDLILTRLKQPTLGICLGMQLMCRHSEENNTDCLNIFDVPVLKIPALNHLKVPHMGWNKLEKVGNWINPTVENQYMYFVHSYYVPVNEFTNAQTDYGVDISAAMRKNNFFAVQFHPEKSADYGLIVLNDFLKVNL